MTDFAGLGVAETVLRALRDEGYARPTPIQARAIPSILEGRDLLGIAQTGTGKTCAFAVPIIQRLIEHPRRAAPGTVRALILAPTRELAAQIGESFRAYGRHARLRVAVVVGGVSMGPQIQNIAKGLDVLVATPGRLLDHVDSRRLRLDATEVVVLDEADHMLDLGFIVPIRRIVGKLPKARQTLFFSATMPREIASLADDMLSNPARVEVTPVATTAERVSQKAYLVDHASKRELLVEILSSPDASRALVFTRTKRGADRVARILEEAGIPSGAIHGNKSQNNRQRTLNDFKAGKLRALVATDIAARGIDVDGVSHVVNFELPEVPETYVHRIGRTARAGAAGVAISLCDNGERALLRAIEKTTRQQIETEDRRNPSNRSEQAERAPARAKPRPHNGHSRGKTSERPRSEAGRTHGQHHGAARPAANRDQEAKKPAGNRPGSRARRRHRAGTAGPREA
ncbi:MAG: DEAD/DEAH box helicase [Hyphomicrobiales bacterium]|nr:DEAD/DEAH box helicase [Hyphomicrobiales bacterium]